MPPSREKTGQNRFLATCVLVDFLDSVEVVCTQDASFLENPTNPTNWVLTTGEIRSHFRRTSPQLASTPGKDPRRNKLPEIVLSRWIV